MTFRPVPKGGQGGKSQCKGPGVAGRPGRLELSEGAGRRAENGSSQVMGMEGTCRRAQKVISLWLWVRKPLEALEAGKWGSVIAVLCQQDLSQVPGWEHALRGQFVCVISLPCPTHCPQLYRPWSLSSAPWDGQTLSPSCICCGMNHASRQREWQWSGSSLHFPSPKGHIPVLAVAQFLPSPPWQTVPLGPLPIPRVDVC